MAVRASKRGKNSTRRSQGRTRAIERHRFEEADIALMMDCVRDHAIFTLDSDGRVSSWGASAERITGYSCENILGAHFANLYTNDKTTRDRLDRLLDETCATGRVEEEGWHAHKDGTQFWANTVIAVMRTNTRRLRGFAIIIRDLTERKRIEETQGFLDEATITLAATLDPSGILLEVARLAVARLADWCLVHLSDESGVLTHVATTHQLPEKEDLVQRIGREVPTQRDFARGTWRVYRTGCTEVYSQITDASWIPSALGTTQTDLVRELGVAGYICVPIVARGRTVGTVSLFRSSPSRRYTANDVSLAEEFARRAGLALDNARLHKQAQEAIRVRDEFLSVASHELKTPLTPLQLQLDAIDIILNRSGVQNDPLKAKLQVAKRQTKRLSRLVESLLDVSRITAGRLHLDREEFDLTEMVHEVSEQFRDEAARVGCNILIEAAVPVVGWWDRLRLEQIFSNVLSNAIKYGANSPIRIEVLANDGNAKLSVSDNGIGIHPDALGRIFERFERAVSSQHYGGLGLGLHIARQLTEAHGGTINAHSAIGSGSTFTLILPQHAAATDQHRNLPEVSLAS